MILTTRASSKRTQAIAQQRETRLAALQTRAFLPKATRRTKFLPNQVLDQWQPPRNFEGKKELFQGNFSGETSRRERF